MKPKVNLLQIILSTFFAFCIISFFFSGDKKFENLALGTATSSYRAKDKFNNLIDIFRINEHEEIAILNGWIKRGQKKVIFFLGNSQTHGINQKQKDDINIIELLHDTLKCYNVDVLCNSFPNASMQEFYLSFKYWQGKLPIKTLIIPIFFDDFREDGIRDVFFDRLVKTKFLLPDSSNKLIQKINLNLKSYWGSKVILESNERNEATTQEKVEYSINNYLANNIVTWNQRENVRGDFFVWIYKLRNTIFGIKAQTIRKMIPLRFESNMETLKLILADAKNNNVKVILYIPPIRNDVILPYEKADYQKFKKDILNLKAVNCMVLDFDDIIPGKLWGYKEATNLLEKREVDYMHFQFKGHQILADSLFRYIKE